MTQNNKGQYSVIPYHWYGLKKKYDNGITMGDGELTLLSLIVNLSENPKHTYNTCSASNPYLASILHEDSRTIRRRLQKLKEVGLINVKLGDLIDNKTSYRLIYPQYQTITELAGTYEVIKEPEEPEVYEQDDDDIPF